MSVWDQQLPQGLVREAHEGEQMRGRALAAEEDRDRYAKALKSVRRNLRDFGRGTGTDLDRLILRNIKRIDRALKGDR